MRSITFELTFNEVNEALSEYVKKRAVKAMGKQNNSELQSFVSFQDGNRDQVGVEFATVTIK